MTYLTLESTSVAALACSGTAEELHLLEAHLGIFDAHCDTYEEFMTDAAIAAWEKEIEAVLWEAEESIYSEKYDNQFEEF